MYKNGLVKDRRGMTGLETAIILVAFVITAAAFSFVVLNMGFLTAQKSQTVIASGMEEASSSMLCDGEVVGHFNTTTTRLEDVTFYVKLSAGKEPVDLDDDKLLITYANPRQSGILYSKTVTNGTVVSITQVQGDDDSLLESGETFKVFANFTAADTHGGLTANDLYTVEYESFRVVVRPITGSVLTIERGVPAVNDEYQVLD
jgi:flagellin FlaB